MAGKSRHLTPWKPEHEAWVRAHADGYGWASRALWRAFNQHFGLSESYSAFTQWARRVRDGSHAQIPVSPADDIPSMALDLKCKAALITSDHHVPYHDADLLTFALELGRAWGCDMHVMNGDVYDAGMASKFPPMLYGERFTMSDELKMGRAIMAEMARGFDRCVYVMGSNHEARWFANFFQGQLDSEDMGRLLAIENVEITPLGYCLVNGKRVTHPGAASIIPTAVGAVIASNFRQDVISAHGHTIGYRRSSGGHDTVIDTGGLFDARRIAYLQQRDKRRPLTNQGFAIVDGDYIYLFDAGNLDRELWLDFARTRRKARAA